MTDAGDIASSFLRAYYQGDVEAARQLLADDVSFEGPAASFTGADLLIASSAHVAPSVKRLEIRKVFIDNQDVCVWYDVHLLDHSVTSFAVAQMFVLHERNIAATRMIFDNAPFGGDNRQNTSENIAR